MKFRIVLIDFPFDDLSGTKLRPAVCLTDFISQHKHIIFAFITSNINAATELTDLVIEDSDIGFKQTGLKSFFCFKASQVTYNLRQCYTESNRNFAGILSYRN